MVQWVLKLPFHTAFASHISRHHSMPRSRLVQAEEEATEVDSSMSDINVRALAKT